MKYIKTLLTLSILISNLLFATEKDISSKCSFLCHLDKETKSSIVLIGEKHHSELGNRVRDKCRSLACSGDIYLGLEGKLEGKSAGLHIGTCKSGKSLMYGLENTDSMLFIDGFNSYYYLVSDLKHNNSYETILTQKLSFIVTIGSEKNTRKIWGQISKNYKSKFPQFVALLDKYVNTCIKQKSISMNFIKEKLMTNDAFMNNLDAFIELSKAFAYEVGILTQKKFGFSDEEFGCYFDLLNDPYNSKNEALVAYFLVHFRNIIMAENLAKLYCEAKTSGKNIYAIVGALHLDGIKTFLENSSEGKVKIETIDLRFQNYEDFAQKIAQSYDETPSR